MWSKLENFTGQGGFLASLCRCLYSKNKNLFFVWKGLPVGNEPKAGVLPRNLAFLGGCYPSMVRVANFYAAQVARAYERNFIDAHYEFTSLPHLRVSDDIHWNPVGHRSVARTRCDVMNQDYHESVPSSH